MLDDGGGRLVELEDDAGGGVEVEEVGVRKLLALDDGGRLAKARRDDRSNSTRIPRRPLVRVLAVPQVADLLERQRGVRRQQIGLPSLERRPAERDVAERGRDAGVVPRRVRERLARELEAETRLGVASSWPSTGA